ncbi:MAG: alpha-ketoglutarate-dependent dioxygenase AlkB [Paracoccaceae bacterium]|nr:alpha-ketoglutarate-dependent dioxygenase AlkB [Paracoccaceae bacterium]
MPLQAADMCNIGKMADILPWNSLRDVMTPINLNNSLIFAGALEVDLQRKLVTDLRNLAREAPFRQYETRSGRKIGVRMTAAGDYGWISDRAGYRYETTQPDGSSWPNIPRSLIEIWQRFAGCLRDPQCCLVNYYGANTRMGLHQDKDEADLSLPVLSISLGDDALFRVGGTIRSDSTKSIWLKSGDVCLLTGSSRMAFHGIDKLRLGSSKLLANGGRINVTMRVVD